MFTSSTSGEGKTFNAANTAVSAKTHTNPRAQTTPTVLSNHRFRRPFIGRIELLDIIKRPIYSQNPKPL